MTTYIEYKVIPQTSWLGSEKFKVVKMEIQAGKPRVVVSEKVLFSGDILKCEAYLRLLNSDNLLL